MIEIIRQVLPYLLMLFFIIKGIKEPLYFLGIPFLMLMSSSIFFDGVNLFNFPGRMGDALPFMWFVIIWLISVAIHFYQTKDEIRKKQAVNEMDLFVAGLIVITLIGFGLTLKTYSALDDVFVEFLNLVSLFVCYFIIKVWISDKKPEVLINFLFCIVVINSIASLFYILHQGLHFRIYEETENFIVYLQGKELTRTFWFMPQLLLFSVVFLLVFKEKKIFYMILLAINLLAVFITYTRSFVLNVVIVFLCYSFLTGFRRKSLRTIFKNLAIFAFIGLAGILIVSKVFPTNVRYLMNRFSEIDGSSAFRESNTLQYRFFMTGYTFKKIDGAHIVQGMGSVTEKQVPWVTQMKQTTSDMVWAGVVFRWGYAGLVLFALLYIFSIIRAFELYMKTEGLVSDLALMFLLLIISQIIESFVSWTFLSGHGYAMGLWYFAMLSVLVGKEKKGVVSEIKISAR